LSSKAAKAEATSVETSVEALVDIENAPLKPSDELLPEDAMRAAKNVSFVRRVIAAGIDPVNSENPKFRRVRCDRRPIDSGIVPLNSGYGKCENKSAPATDPLTQSMFTDDCNHRISVHVEPSGAGMHKNVGQPMAKKMSSCVGRDVRGKLLCAVASHQRCVFNWH
jgi:hypothetical protein